MGVSGRRNRVLSRIMQDDESLGSDSIPTSKLNASLPKKRKPAPKKKPVEDSPPPKKKGGKSDNVMKAIEACLEKIEELSSELAEDLTKGEKKTAKEIAKLAASALEHM